MFKCRIEILEENGKKVEKNKREKRDSRKTQERNGGYRDKSRGKNKRIREKG